MRWTPLSICLVALLAGSVLAEALTAGSADGQLAQPAKTVDRRGHQRAGHARPVCRPALRAVKVYRRRLAHRPQDGPAAVGGSGD